MQAEGGAEGGQRWPCRLTIEEPFEKVEGGLVLPFGRMLELEQEE